MANIFDYLDEEDEGNKSISVITPTAGNSSSGGNIFDFLDELPDTTTPTTRREPLISMDNLRSSHASTDAPIQQDEPNYKAAWIKGTLGSLAGRALTPLAEKITGKEVDLSTLPEQKTLGEKAVSFAGSNLSDLPAWVSGDALLARPLAALAKTEPIAKAASLLPKAITPALGTGVRAGSTYALPINAAESVVDGEGIEGFTERLKEAPLMALGGSLLHGGGQLAGKGIGEVSNVLADRRLGQIAQPLDEAVKNSFRKPSPITKAEPLQLSPKEIAYNAKQSELNDVFKNLPIGSMDTPVATKTLQQSIDDSMGIGRPTGEYGGLGAFGKPLNTFRKNTDSRDAVAEISTKMEKQVQDIAKSLKQADGQTKIESIRNQVKARGGIKQGNSDIFEEQKVIPNWIRNDKTGRPLDEVADELGMSSDELLTSISDSAYKPKDYVTEAYRVAHNDPEYQALSNTLDTIKGELPQKRTLDAIPKLKPRELTPSPEPLPIEQPKRWQLSGTLPENTPPTVNVLNRPSPLIRTNESLIKDRMPFQGLRTPAEIPTLGNSVEAPIRLGQELPRIAPAVNQPGSDLASRIELVGITELPEPQSKIIIGKPKEKIGFKEALNKFYTATVNTQQPIVNAGKVAESDIGKLASNTRNVSGIVDHNFLTSLVDKEGNAVGDSLKSTVEAIPKGQEKEFWTYMSQRHNVDRAREGKSVQANYTPEMSADAVKIAEEAHPEYKAAGDGIVNWLDSFMKTWGVDTGIVNKDLYKGLRETYKSYFPTQRDFSELEKAIPDNVSQKFADQRTPIRKATGSERDIIDPVENIMQLVNRTVRTAKYNEVGQSLLESVRRNPEKMKALAEVIPTKDGMFANTDNVISVLEDGKATYLKINDKMLLDAMNGLPKSIGNIPVLSTIMNGFKGLITQKNPVFAIRNIFRDVPTAYVYGSEANPLKFGAGLIGAGKDILTNSPRLQKYNAVGGGGANFFSSGDVTKSAAELMGKDGTIKKIVSTPLKAIEKFNNLTETAPRLAEFNRIMDKTGDVTKALYAANDVTVNFARGGNVTKNVDKVTPYLNAGVQGLDKFVRGFISPKAAISTIIKSGVAVTSPTLALYVVNKDNPNYQALDNRTKDNYFLIPKEDGTFFKIPKSRELGVLFSSLLERGLRMKDGQENSFKGFGNTVKTNFSPANPFDASIVAPIMNLDSNKDFADRPIVPRAMVMDKRSDYLQYDEKTTSVAKAIGEMTKGMPGNEDGLSPKQLDYLIKSYSGVLGQIGIPLATPGGTPGKALTSQFNADPAFSSQVTTDFYDKLDKLSAGAVDKNILEKVPSKKLTPEEDIKNSMNGVSLALSRGTKLINSIQASDDPSKDEQIKAIKAQMLSLTSRAVAAKTAKEMQSVENVAKKLWDKK